jgi:excisionase family DNA binding protein
MEARAVQPSDGPDLRDTAAVETPSQPPQIMTAKEAARFLRLSKSTLAHRQDIPRHRLPGMRAVRFDRDELLNWAKSGDADEKRTRLAEDPERVDIPLLPIYHRSSRYR